MELTSSNILLFGSILLIISIFTSKTSYRTGVPTLLIFLVIGMMAGSDGVGGVHFNNLEDAQFIGTVALIFILYSGGLDTKKENIVPVIAQGLVLSFLGVLITALVLGYFIHYVTDFNWIESMLLSSIVSSTDAASVFAIFRSRNMGISNKISSTLELESGSNDPMAYLLTITFLDLMLKPEMQGWDVVLLFLKGVVFGGLLGIAFGFITVKIINKINLSIDGLYPVLVIAMAVLTFAATDYVQGNGYLAVYIAALILGNSNFVHKRSIIRTYDGINWFMQVVMFLMLGLFVNPRELMPIIGIGLLISFFMILVARPVAVFLCLIPFKVKLNEKLLISWVGLRGAVPIIFATYPLAAGIPQAHTIFNIVFFIAVISLLVQGMTIPQVARLLGLAVDKPPARKRIDFDKYTDSLGGVTEVLISDTCPSIGKSIVELGLPQQLLIVMVHRDDMNFAPNGSTILKAGDKLLVVADSPHMIFEMKEILGIKETDHKTKHKTKIDIGTAKKNMKGKINIQ